MTVFETARELARQINESEQAVARDKAQELFLRDREAIELMQEYESFQRNIETKMRKGEMSQEQFMSTAGDLRMLGAEVKANPVAGAYIDSVNDFNKLLNQVFNIIQSAVTGQSGEGCEGCGGDCGSADGDDCGCSCGCNH